MTEAAETLKAALLQLPEADRWALLGALVRSLPGTPGVLSEGDPAFDAELDRRLAEHESGRDKGIPTDEFFRRLREKRREARRAQ